MTPSSYQHCCRSTHVIFCPKFICFCSFILLIVPQFVLFYFKHRIPQKASLIVNLLKISFTTLFSILGIFENNQLFLDRFSWFSVVDSECFISFLLFTFFWSPWSLLLLADDDDDEEEVFALFICGLDDDLLFSVVPAGEMDLSPGCCVVILHNGHVCSMSGQETLLPEIPHS